MWKQALLDVARIRHADGSERLQLEAEGSRIEWLCKWQIIERLRLRLHPGESFDESLRDARLASVDLRWASLDPQASIFDRLRGRTERTCTDDEVRTACGEPPEDTRAWLRGTMVDRYPEQIRAVSWTHITTTDDADGRQWTLDMRDPRAYTRDDCTEAVAQTSNAWSLIQTLCQQGGA